MRNSRRGWPAALLCAAVLMAPPFPAAAEIELQDLGWQIVSPHGPQTIKTVLSVDALRLSPGKPFSHRILARLRFLNRGSAQVGILLRYSLTAKIAPLEGGAEPAWAIPFHLDTKRVPRVAANSQQEAVLDPTSAINVYLKKAHRDGYWPREIKLEVMVDPRREQKSRLQVLESVIPIRRG